MGNCLVQLAAILNFCLSVLLDDVIKKVPHPKKVPYPKKSFFFKKLFLDDSTKSADEFQTLQHEHNTTYATWTVQHLSTLMMVLTLFYHPWWQS